MKKELFIASIEALKKQYEYDIKIAKKLSEAFPYAFEANLLYDNHFVSNALIKVLQVENNDLEHEESWIKYFCFELDFGAKFKIGMVEANGQNVDLSDAGKLWDYLNRKKNKKNSELYENTG